MYKDVVLDFATNSIYNQKGFQAIIFETSSFSRRIATDVITVRVFTEYLNRLGH